MVLDPGCRTCQVDLIEVQDILHKVQDDNDAVWHYQALVRWRWWARGKIHSIPKQLKQYNFDFRRGVDTLRMIYYEESMLSSQPREGCQCTNHFLDQEIVDKLDLSVSG